MTTAKVSLSVDLDKLKVEKKLTAKICCIDGCSNFGEWNNKQKNFYLKNNMCIKHYIRFKNYGNPNTVIHLKNGQTKHPLYGTWAKMKDRIVNPKNDAYCNYGGRGLGIEPRWIEPVNGFFNFLEDIVRLGERPKVYSLDRKKNEIGYFIGNLRWANVHTQASNKRNNNENVGVSFDKLRNKYVASFTIKGKQIKKRFATEQAAIIQRKFWEIQYEIYN